MNDATARESKLEDILRKMGSAVVAFSGGVDSAYLAVVAGAVLGPRALAVTGESPSYPRNQREIALGVAGEFSLRHEFLPTREMEDPAYRSNPIDRCYFCKHELFTRLRDLARERGFGWVADGSNLDDTGDHRPGRAAGSELAVRSPLIEAGLGKEEIRLLSRRRGLGTWDLPASACLSSRIPYGSPVTVEKLRMIEDAEEHLRRLGFPQTRVRHHGEIARIEIPREDLGRFLDLGIFDGVVTRFRELGFRYVSLDLEGYRMGRLNETLHQIEGSRS